MKTSYYDVLQVSAHAEPDVISAAYARLKASAEAKLAEGDSDARNRLLFLEEAFEVLSSPERRKAYDQKMSLGQGAAQFRFAEVEEPAKRGGFSWIFLLVALACAGFGAYKFMGQGGRQKVEERKLEVIERRDLGEVRNEAYRAETERMNGQGAIQLGNNAVDKSYEIASREQERRQAESDYRANAGAQMLEMQRQQQEAHLQELRWRQEQYEKERQLAERRLVADEPKRQLCTMYQLNGKFAEARAAGCDRGR